MGIQNSVNAMLGTVAGAMVSKSIVQKANNFTDEKIGKSAKVSKSIVQKATNFTDEKIGKSANERAKQTYTIRKNSKKNGSFRNRINVSIERSNK